MASAGTSWRMAHFRPGSDPIRAMAQALVQPDGLFRTSDIEGMSVQEIVEATLRMSKLGLVDAYEQSVIDQSPNLLVIVDQFEELFRYRNLQPSAGGGQGSDEKAIAFVNLLLEAALSPHPIYIVITMRSDFLGDCAQFEGLPEAINRGQYLVPRMTRDERRSAIAGPAAVSGGEISPILLTRLVNDVGDNPDQLSILQHALNRTWAEWQRQGGAGAMDLPHYEAVGTMTHALDYHAEKAYGELQGEQQKRICEKVFQAITDKGTDARGIRRPTSAATLCAITGVSIDELTSVLAAFRKPSRSFVMPPVSDTIAPDTVIDISHESLMRVWNRLKGWVDDEARSASQYRRLSENAERHAAREAGLMTDPELSLMLDWLQKRQLNAAWGDRYRPGFTKAIAFLDESRQRRDEEVAAEKERQRRELRRTRLVAAVLAMLAIVSIYEWRRAKQGERIATSRQLLAQSEELLSQKPLDLELPALLAVRSLCLQPSPDADWTVRKATELQPRASIPVLLGGPATAVAFTGSGKWFSAADTNGWVKVFETENGKEVFAVQSSAPVSAVSVSEDGKWLVTGTDHGAVTLFDMVSGAQHLFLGTRTRVNALAFSPDQTRLAVAFDNTALILQASSGKEISHVTHGSAEEHGDPRKKVVAVSFSPDGKLVASGSWDRTARVSESRTGRTLSELQHAESVKAVAFSPDGKQLVTGSADKTIRVFDVRHGTLQASTPQTGVVDAVAFSPNGKTIGSLSEDGSARVFDAATGVELLRLVLPGQRLEGPHAIIFSSDGKWVIAYASGAARRFATSDERQLAHITQDGSVDNLAYSADGKWIATGSYDGSARVFEAGSGKEVTRVLYDQDRPVNDVAFSADGSLVATAGSDTTARVLESYTGAEVARLEHPAAVAQVTFSADAKWLATGSNDQKARVFEIATGKEIVVLPHDGAVKSVVFSPNGKLLASGSNDGKTRVFEIATGKLIIEVTHGQPVNVVTFSPNGKWLASGGNDNKIWIIDASIGKVVQQLDQPAEVNLLEFSPDSKLIVSSGNSVGNEFGAHVFNLATGKEVARVKLTGRGRMVRFADPHTLLAAALAAGTQNSVTISWHALLPQDVVDEACRSLTTDLTPGQWKQYFRDIQSQDKICPCRVRN